jgi:hypothetical protein
MHTGTWELSEWRGRATRPGLEPVFYTVSVPAPQCPRCLELEDELAEARQQLAAAGRFVTSSPGPNPNLDLERELKRWLDVNPRADAAAGFRAGWARLARWARPRFRELEDRWLARRPRKRKPPLAYWCSPDGAVTVNRPGLTSSRRYDTPSARQLVQATVLRLPVRPPPEKLRRKACPPPAVEI